MAPINHNIRRWHITNREAKFIYNLCCYTTNTQSITRRLNIFQNSQLLCAVLPANPQLQLAATNLVGQPTYPMLYFPH